MRRPYAVPVSKVMLVQEQELPFAQQSLRSAEDLNAIFAPLAAGLPVEGFWVAALNSAHAVIGVAKLYQGTINMAAVSPREVFQYLVLANAAAFAVSHNHPSGEAYPSHQDKELTRALMAAAQTMNMRMLDHVITAGGKFFSFRKEGLL